MNLPTKYRRVVHLFYYEGFSVKEISKLLSQKESATTTQLNRARKILKSKLSEVWEDEQ